MIIDPPPLDHLSSNAPVEEVKGPEASPQDDEDLLPLPHATPMSAMIESTANPPSPFAGR